MSNNPYTFTDNPMVSGVSICNTDIVNDNIMALKWMHDHISFRNIGEIVTSTIPLTDAGLHLLDGALISGSGIYSDFVDYIADLYSEEETAWQQPVLTSNGTMGGVNYACEASSYESDFYAYKAFDNDTSTRWGSVSDAVPDWLTFYSPYPLKVSEVYLDFYQTTERYISGEIQGSNDNSNWTTLTTFSNNSSQTLTLPISTNDKYKYIRFYGTSITSDGWGKVAKFNITATYTKIPNFFTTEENWQSAVTTYGVCGKFVYNSTNNTIRLPKITGILEGTTDVTALGDLMEAGLPSLELYSPNSAYRYGSQPNYIYNASGVSGNANSIIRTDPSDTALYIKDSNNIVGNSSTVQPQTIKAFYYIVIATSTKTEIQVDIDEIATDLNGKADVDLTNVNDTGYIKMAGASMPSNTYENLTLGASGTNYTAPSNGWIFLSKVVTAAGQYIQIDVSGYSATSIAQNSGNGLQIFLPAQKNDEFRVYYSAAGNTNFFRFIYAQGSESEAS